jgi:hypothetical protein
MIDAQGGEGRGVFGVLVTQQKQEPGVASMNKLVLATWTVITVTKLTLPTAKRV